MTQLAAGVTVDDDGTLHLDLPVMLAVGGYADTPENREALEAAARQWAAENCTVIEATDEPAPRQ